MWICHSFFGCKVWTCLTLCFALLVSGCNAVEKVNPPSTPLSAKEASLFYSYVTDRIKREYIEKVDDSTLLEGALNGILSSLDPYSAYLDPAKYDTLKNQAQGHYGGLGIEMFIENGTLLVITALDDSPAQKAGVLPGDHIIAIDKQPVYRMTSLEAADKLRGVPGTKVLITIKRENSTPFDLTLNRAFINTKPVKWYIENQIGYIRISTFNQETTKELLKAIREIKNKTSRQDFKGYILDLRNNSGGLLEEAVSVSDVFLNGGKIVAIRGRDPKKDLHFSANPGDFTGGAPLMVLINGGTASASEIVAAALQDNKRALIVGTKSFGKGSVQSVIPLTNKGAIKITIALYYTPLGRTIQKNGIEPDVKIEQQITQKLSHNGSMKPSTLENTPYAPQQEINPHQLIIEKRNKSEKGLFKDIPDYQLKKVFTLMKTRISQGKF